MSSEPWRVSLHGGHSGEFCEHAEATLRQIVEAAVAAGYHTFGVSEHAPRSEARFVYASEAAKGYDVARLGREFDAYAQEVCRLRAEFADRVVLLCGFEAEVVPGDRYAEEMLAHRNRHDFDYMVGSVHYVDEISIDGPRADFDRAVASAGGLEQLALRYYDQVAEMADTLRPEVVGHLDLLRKNAGREAPLDTAPIRRVAERALEAIGAVDAILDLNTAGYRKGLGTPYPAPWLVRRAEEMGIPFCFGDDSHRPDEVGNGVDEARRYLQENGVGHVTVLTREGDDLVRRRIALD
jgi:histidinol-phosphatase (PHP family)